MLLSIINAVAGHPWAIRGELAAHVNGLLAKDGIAGLRHLAEVREIFKPKAMEDEDYGEGYEARRPGTFQSSGNVAVIQIWGPLTQRGGMDMQTCEAFQSTAGIAASVEAAISDKSVDSILLDIDSPGGSVFGVEEAWGVIMEARKQKPIVAVVNSQCASAAFWLASAANEIFITPSGQIGSVGVFTLHIDASEALAQAGFKWTFISAGEFKVEGNPASPLAKEAAEYFQSSVDEYYSAFNTALSRGRDIPVADVRKNFGKGRMVGARQAVDNRMADRVGTYDEALRRTARLGVDRRSGVNTKARAEDMLPEPKADESSTPEPADGIPASVNARPVRRRTY